MRAFSLGYLWWCPKDLCQVASLTALATTLSPPLSVVDSQITLRLHTESECHREAAGALGPRVTVRLLHPALTQPTELASCLSSDLSCRVWGRQVRSCLEGSLIVSTRI